MGNFDHVIEEAYQKSYRPFAEALLLHPKISLSLHASGVLLEWLEGHHPEFFILLRQLVDRGQAELVGGGYYEPILLSIPDEDKIAQIHKLSDYLHKYFRTRARGAWVAERVWEPGLTRSLAEADVEYVILDDTHFLATGMEPAELRGSFITEEGGLPLQLIPSLKSLRYTIPFHEPEETLRILRDGYNATDATEPLFAMGDDWEKFGVWPGTFEHCYTNKWLERFLSAIEGAGDWLETTTLSNYLHKHPPLGRIYLPSASYEEMMEWALPVPAAREFKSAMEHIAGMSSGARIRRFMRGGIWRNFFTKYPESNQIHKLMLEVSRRWHAAGTAVKRGTHSARLLHDAQSHLLAAQCNDAYWHGVFGGLYAPHLRSALLRNLIQAEVLLDKLEGASEKSPLRIQTKDFDVDGKAEVLIDHPSFAMVLRPADGGTISSLRAKPAGVEVINSLMRREEAYHDQVLRQVDARKHAPREGPASIHDHVLSKEANLSALLRYDRYARHAFRTYIFHADKRCEDFDYLRLQENTDLAGGEWTLAAKDHGAGIFVLEREAFVRLNGEDAHLRAVKSLQARMARGALKLNLHSKLLTDRPIPAPLALGVELVFNLLAPDAPDRYFLANDIRQPLEFRGEILAPHLVMVDEWQRVKISIEGSPQPRWWIHFSIRVRL